MNTYIVTLKIKIEAESKMDVWEEVNKLIENEKLVAVTENWR